MLSWLLVCVVLVLTFLGECIVIGDNGIESSECVWEVGCMGDRSGMCGKDEVFML